MNCDTNNTIHPSVAIATLGCKLNQAESEDVTRRLQEAGYRLVSFDGHSDVYIINTCTVTHIADRKSRQLIRQAKRHNPAALIVVTGCYAEVSAEEVARTECADLIVGNQDKHRINELLSQALSERQLPPAEMAFNEEQGHSRTREFLKIQEGCNNFCAYCIVPVARGRERSWPIDEVMAKVRHLVDQGRQEIVLTGVNIGAYGRGAAGSDQPGLYELARRILNETNLPRLRLSSIEPEDFDPRLIPLMEEGRLARHLHLPLQSGCDQILHLMRRHYNTRWYLELVQSIREQIPEIAITTDVIVGFPGERETEFLQTVETIKQANFAGMHVFKYSARRGTRAVQLPNQVPYEAKQQRSKVLLRISRELSRAYRQKFVDQTLETLFERAMTAGQPSVATTASASPSAVWEGLTDNYIRVFARSEEALSDQIRPTHLLSLYDNGLWGKLQASENHSETLA